MIRLIENALYAWLRQRRIERKRRECNHDWEDLKIEYTGDLTANTMDVQYCTECDARRMKPILSTSTTNTGYGSLTTTPFDPREED